MLTIILGVFHLVVCAIGILVLLLVLQAFICLYAVSRVLELPLKMTAKVLTQTKLDEINEQPSEEEEDKSEDKAEADDDEPQLNIGLMETGPITYDAYDWYDREEGFQAVVSREKQFHNLMGRFCDGEKVRIKYHRREHTLVIGEPLRPGVD